MHNWYSSWDEQNQAMGIITINYGAHRWHFRQCIGRIMGGKECLKTTQRQHCDQQANSLYLLMISLFCTYIYVKVFVFIHTQNVYLSRNLITLTTLWTWWCGLHSSQILGILLKIGWCIWWLEFDYAIRWTHSFNCLSLHEHGHPEDICINL